MALILSLIFQRIVFPKSGVEAEEAQCSSNFYGSVVFLSVLEFYLAKKEVARLPFLHFEQYRQVSTLS